MKKRDVHPEEAIEKIQKVFKKRGKKALEMARKEILQEKLECKEAKEALAYFVTKYWHDLARPSLLSLVCEAVGGDPELTTPIAIPMMLISGAIDIHDDIIDQSKRKYGRLTVYGRYGNDIALLVGDSLLFKGLTLLNKSEGKGIPFEKIGIIIDIIKNMFFELGDAEALELRFRGDLNVSPKAYLQVIRKKAADVEAHTRVGAILGNASLKMTEALSEYGRLLGMLIILRDDWMDVFDVEESCNRVRKESLPLPLLFGLGNPLVKDKLTSILLQKTVTRKNAESILEIIQETDVHQKYAKLMNELAEYAIQNLRKHKINSEILELLLRTTIPF
jgi:geranylgeranyl pyrophosphate synthase